MLLLVRFCNGTLNRETGEFDYQQSFPGPNDNIVFFDFAGSGVVHMLGGFGGLVLALLCKLDLHKANKKNAKVRVRNSRREDNIFLIPMSKILCCVSLVLYNHDV